MLLLKSGKCEICSHQPPFHPTVKKTKPLNVFVINLKVIIVRKKKSFFFVWLWMLTRHCGDYL